MSENGKDVRIEEYRTLIIEMGRIIRHLDEGCEWVEWWTNDGNEHGPDYNHGLNRLEAGDK